MTAPTSPQPQREYIIDEEYIQKLDEWLDEHGIDELQRMQIRTRLKFVPNIANGWSIHQYDFDRLAKLVVNCDTPEATKLKAWGDNIRTRPHPQEPDIIPMTKESLQAFKDEIARTATLATLDKLIQLIDSDNCPFPKDKPCPGELDCEHCCIESIRQSTTAQERP
jgi:hypothetical protein